jgi:nucleoside-diphosphate-sugar epimerase
MDAKGLVLVTGAAGFIGSHVVHLLLSRGYSVRGSVKPGSIDKIGLEELYRPFQDFDEVRTRLQFLEVDLSKDENWDAAFSDVVYVIHCAAPCVVKPSNPDLELFQPAVEGAKRVIAYCQKYKQVKKLIHLSCHFALSGDFENGRIYDEKDWNTTSSLSDWSHIYRYC